MDRTTEQLVDFALSFDTSELTEPVKEAALLHLVDSVACAVVGFTAESSRIAAKLARTVTGSPSATVFGHAFSTSPEMAAFVNTTMVRAWDWNDGMLARGGGHPSDMVGALLVAGEVAHANGPDFLTAMVLSYEVLGSLGDSAPVRDLGWDQGTFMGTATALGVGRLMGLSAIEVANAVSLALVPNVPLRVSRTGNLSMWKGCATAAAVRNAVFAVRLAQAGMTAPEDPFEGKTALWDQVTGPFELTLPRYPEGKRVVELSHMKQFPAETHSQALLGLVPAIREWTSVDEIKTIDISIYWQAYHEIGSHPSKWDPQTRESADHSLPYLLAVALVDGTIALDSFTPERISDPALRPLMAKISVEENVEYTAAFRPTGGSIAGEPRAHITISSTSGRTMSQEVTYARGHSKNPMTRDDVDLKLEVASRGVLSADAVEMLKDTWWNVLDVNDIGSALTTLARFDLVEPS